MQNISPVPPIKYPTAISHTKVQNLNTKITADFKLSQEVWKQLSSQMNKMAETKKKKKHLNRQYREHTRN